jgi:hypothetical protein
MQLKHHWVTKNTKCQGKGRLIPYQTKDNTTLDFEAATALNLEIAENCLTKIKGESMNK